VKEHQQFQYSSKKIKIKINILNLFVVLNVLWSNFFVLLIFLLGKPLLDHSSSFINIVRFFLIQSFVKKSKLIRKKAKYIQRKRA
jgi:hypothetical protein